MTPFGSFPRIDHIDDVLPHVTEGIKVRERDGYLVVDYTYASPGTFTNSVNLECRGLKFDTSGTLIARPLHKFFNVGERQQVNEIDWRQAHTVYEKLDGSMVHGCGLDGDVVLMTRGGISPQAEMAMERASESVWSLLRHCVSKGITPVFEFTSPDNRIVVPYTRDEITLLAARDNESGEYIEISGLSSLFDVPSARRFSSVGDPYAFVSSARELVGSEGYVIAFESGHRLKIKGDDYVYRHTALATIGSEKRVLQMVLDGADDDMRHLLPEVLQDRLSSYKRRLDAKINDLSAGVLEFVSQNASLERKGFAQRAKQTLDGPMLPAAFAALDGRDPSVTIRSFLRTASSTEKRRDALRDVFPISWSLDDIPVHELTP